MSQKKKKKTTHDLHLRSGIQKGAHKLPTPELQEVPKLRLIEFSTAQNQPPTNQKKKYKITYRR